MKDESYLDRCLYEAWRQGHAWQIKVAFWSAVLAGAGLGFLLGRIL